MTPDEFLKRVLEAVEEAAFRLSHTPHDRQEQWLQGFADRLGTQWCEVFAPYLLSAEVDGLVADVIFRIKAKRDLLESLGGGTT
jgi:hypothetical protein